MSSFELNKRHLRKLLIYFFNLKKYVAEAHRLLVEKYKEDALNEKSCREWFQKFKIREFDIEDKERRGRIRYDNPKRKKSWLPPGHASTSTAKLNIHGKKTLVVYLVGSAWCRVL